MNDAAKGEYEVDSEHLNGGVRGSQAESERRTSITESLRETGEMLVAVSESAEVISHAADLMVRSIVQGGKVMWCGNGGSAADAQHLAAELVGRYEIDRKPFASIALTVDSSVVTALGNDYGFDSVFSRQVEALGLRGDTLVGITTSGRSSNVIAALQRARELGIRVVALCGSYTELLEPLCDVVVAVNAERTFQIQTAHIAVGQVICGLVESELSQEEP